MLIFFQRLKVFSGIQIISSELSFCQGVRDFPGGGRLIFFPEDVQFFWVGEYILKLAFSHDKVLPCILQDTLI